MSSRAKTPGRARATRPSAKRGVKRWHSAAYGSCGHAGQSLLLLPPQCAVPVRKAGCHALHARRQQVAGGKGRRGGDHEGPWNVGATLSLAVRPGAGEGTLHTEYRVQFVSHPPPLSAPPDLDLPELYCARRLIRACDLRLCQLCSAVRCRCIRHLRSRQPRQSASERGGRVPDPRPQACPPHARMHASTAACFGSVLRGAWGRGSSAAGGREVQ